MPRFSFSASGRPGGPAAPGPVFSGLRRLLRTTRAAGLARALAPLAVFGTLMASATVTVTTTAPAIPPVNLSAGALYSLPAADKATLTLALSVEFPTAGAQYMSGPNADSDYSSEREYLGYYDAESCYSYVDNPQETIAAPYTSKADYKRFRKTGQANGRQCTEAFSGNFLNWASSSAIDMLRLALSGGDRYMDTPDLTILQRAIVPGGPPAPVCMWNNTRYFPAKMLQRNGGGPGRFWGAVPASMITERMRITWANIFIANKGDRIYLGYSMLDGSCDNATTHTIGSSPAIGPVRTVSNTTRPADAQKCADEWRRCDFNFHSIREVWYGNKQSGSVSNWKVAPVINGVDCTNGNFGDPAPGSAKACFTVPYNGSWAGNPDPPAQLPVGAFNSDSFFYARVEVCNSTAGVLADKRSYDFCQPYPNGKYKPAGVIQKYSDRVRLAAFGYLMDQNTANNGRYGGVLRAPMKYVGKTTYDSNGVNNTPASGNPRAEWDMYTGVFLSNPDNKGADPPPASRWPATSGVINYLNKFGRTGRFGMYKDFDPVGELHYEALRYLQGLPPSPAAISGSIDANLTDGFPYYYDNTWSDPYGDGRSADGNYSCQKSSILVIGDVDTHDGNRLPVANPAGNIPDINYWRGKVQDFEKTSGDNYLDGAGVSRPITNPNPRNDAVPTTTYASQIMGTAYWARTHDIRGKGWTAAPALQRPGLRVKTMVFDVNQRAEQNDAGRRRTANQLFMAAKYGGFETDPSNAGRNPYNTRGNPFQDQNGVNDNNVWQRKTDPGEAASYYVYDSNRDSPARAVLSAFDEIFRQQDSSNPQGMAGSALSTGSQITANSVMYTAKFNTGDWSGDIVAYPVSSDASAGNATVQGAQLWSAAQRLDAMEHPEDKRKIFVGKVNDNSTQRDPGDAATLLRWNLLDRSLIDQLDRPAPNAASDQHSAWRTLFLRGDHAYDGDPFRTRKSLLGDIINSNISYSGAPRKRHEGPGYAAFYQKYTSPARTPAVFAGANDGMLHAFNATNGDELFAYIPSWLGPKLSALTDPGYAGRHQSFVDGPSVVAEARTGATDSAESDWKTVLLSGTGGGGSGVFALDVSNPDTFDAANVMWEFTRADDPNIGEVVGAPKIMKIKTASATATEAATYRWFAVVAGGVNNYVPDGAGRFSATGKPALFLLALDKAVGRPWILGDNYYRVDIPIDTTLGTTRATGVLNFSALYGTQGEMTDIYFGDLHGQVWRLQFAGKAPADWSNMDRLSFFKKTGGATAKPLFLARNDRMQSQPVSAAPTLFVGPRVAGRETFHVLFGTGKYLEVSDNTTTGQQSVYALFDNGDPAASTHDGDTAVITARGHLRSGATIDKVNKKVTVPAFLWGYPRALSMSEKLANLNGELPADTATTPHPGWYFDLPDLGERVDQPGRDLGALTAAINSKIPGAAAVNTVDTGCMNSISSGGGNEYVLNVNTGATNYSASTVGLLGAPLFLSNSHETVTGAPDSTGRRIVTTTHRRWSQGQGASQAGDSGNSLTGVAKTPQAAGRLSWRQISNYQDLRHAQPAGASSSNH